MQDCERIIAMIIANYKPERMYQWGSLLRRERFWESSDIDIAVEGLADSACFFSLLAEADDLTDLPLDIVELEHVDPLHAESIRKKGKLVYERE